MTVEITITAPTAPTTVDVMEFDAAVPKLLDVGDESGTGISEE